jgi:hypothetical protein
MYDAIWEIAAMTYLTWDRGLFLNPQYQVGEPGVWISDADFLALDFRAGEAWMVEVTRDPSGLRDKIAQFEAEYAPRIERQLRDHEVVCSRGAWNIGLWVFCPVGSRSSVTARVDAAKLRRFRFTSTEETVAPGSGYTERFR